MCSTKSMSIIATLERIATALERISTTLENIDGDLGDLDSRLYTEDGIDIVDVLDHALTDGRDTDGDGLASVLHDLVTATYEAG